MAGIPPLRLMRSRKATRAKLPQALSVGEETFSLHMKARGFSPVRQYKFHPDRGWKADFAFVEQRVLVEIDGGTRSGGRHTRGKGYQEDCVKTNAAVALGWRVLRYTTEMVTRGLADLQVAQMLGMV